MVRKFAQTGNVHFKRWLSKNGFTFESFARSFEGGEIKIDAVKKWASGDSLPNEDHAKLIAEKYKNCPLVSDYVKRLQKQAKLVGPDKQNLRKIEKAAKQ